VQAFKKPFDLLTLWKNECADLMDAKSLMQCGSNQVGAQHLPSPGHIVHGDQMQQILQKQSKQQAATADSIRALQKRVDEMAVNFSAHNSRILCLEDIHNSDRFAEEKVSCVLRALRRQQQQMTELLQDHELELQRLCLAEPSSARQSESSSSWGGSDIEKSESLLKELRAENASVNAVLLSVRQEKIEVLTAMHTLHVNKSQYPARRTKVSREIQDELTTCSAPKWSSDPLIDTTHTSYFTNTTSNSQRDCTVIDKGEEQFSEL